MLRRIILPLVLLGLTLSGPVIRSAAQDIQPLTPGDVPTTRPEAPSGDGIVHVTDRLQALPSARQALLDFHQRRKTDQPDVQRIQSALLPGAIVTFRVLKNVLTSNPSWEEREFELKTTSDIAYIWVEVGELELGHVDDSDVAALDDALLVKTPAGSVDPGRGIVENNNVYFGAPPDVDGDGRLDILLYDIDPSSSNTGSYVAGFVTSDDLSPFGGGNNKDILYLDTHPGVSSRPLSAVLSTAAHEYQHLIHYNYDASNLELSFVNEGLSEWAEVLNGYPARTMAFMQGSATYNVPLFGWETGDDVLYDYQRAGLYTGYLAERLGPVETASITRNAGRGRVGYEAVLNGAGLDFTGVLKDYHTANYLNDDALGAAYVYAHSAYAGVGRVGYTAIDGRSADSTPETTVYVEPGSAVYPVWKNVTDFSLDLDTIDPFSTLRSRMVVRVLAKKEGVTTLEDRSLPMDAVTYEGTYEEIAVLAIHVRPELTSRVGIKYGAQWSSTIEGTLSGVTYDDGTVPSGTFFSLSAGANGAVATRFESPAPRQSRLIEASVAPFYLNQFESENLPSGLPRDLTIKIWDVAGAGVPGAILFSLAVDDPRPFTLVTTTLNHFSVDLSGYAGQMNGLPDVFYLGYGEAGADQNYMVVGPSANASADVSYVTRGNGQWGNLWETQFSGQPDEYPLNGTVVPVRAVFEILSEPVAAEDDLLLPQKAALEQNYPNPFGQSTTIRYTVPRPGPVQITVFNALGQQVEVLVNRFHEAGDYAVALYGESLPSGLYLYRLDTGTESLTKRMLVVR